MLRYCSAHTYRCATLCITRTQNIRKGCTTLRRVPHAHACMCAAPQFCSSFPMNFLLENDCHHLLLLPSARKTRSIRRMASSSRHCLKYVRNVSAQTVLEAQTPACKLRATLLLAARRRREECAKRPPRVARYAELARGDVSRLTKCCRHSSEHIHPSTCTAYPGPFDQYAQAPSGTSR
jgi:hypothetical protein